MSKQSTARLMTRALLVIVLVVSVWAALTPVRPSLLRWDKADHLAWFAILTTLTAMSFPKIKLRWFLLVMLIPTVGGEILQGVFAPTRDVSWKDIVAGYAGALVALCAIISGKYRSWLVSDPDTVAASL
jgi:VanZ family protein